MTYCSKFKLTNYKNLTECVIKELSTPELDAEVSETDLQHSASTVNSVSIQTLRDSLAALSKEFGSLIIQSNQSTNSIIAESTKQLQADFNQKLLNRSIDPVQSGPSASDTKTIIDL